ncbi:MAG: PEP-CTERM sorting domain-containing protein [Planctomycetota bacterium]
MSARKRHVVGTAAVALLVVILGSAALAAPVIDGRFDPAEGCTNEFSLTLNVEGLKKGDPLIPAPDPGTLWTHVDPGTGDLSLILIQPLSLVDNTYGANAIGWGSDAPSGKGHKFEDLVGSDKAQFTFTDGLGVVVLDVVVDYINQAQQGGAYRSGGVLGNDGDVITGSASGVLEWGTSLDYNFNTLGHNTFLVDSPLSVPDYTDPASAPGCVFEVIYELKIDGDVFGDSGFGGVTIPIVHDSPNKIGKNKVYTDPPENPPTSAIPEAGTLAMFAAGLIGLSRRKRT